MYGCVASHSVAIRAVRQSVEARLSAQDAADKPCLAIVLLA